MLLTVFSLWELFFSCCRVVAVAKENLLETPAIVSLANFQRIQMLRHPRLAFDWLSVSFFDYWPIRMSGLLLLCTELTLCCTELPEDCIYPNRSELSHFFMYIIKRIINTMASIWRKNTLLYLSLDNVCSSKLTDFFELRSRIAVRFSERIWSNAAK